MTDKIKLVKCLFLWVFAPHWLAPHQLQFLHTESPSMPVCWPPFVKVQPMYWISCPLFFTLSGEFHFYYYYYCSPVYDSSFIACAILFLLAQGCHNDIKKLSCLLSCDQYSTSTGLAGVSCGTKDNCQVNCELLVAWSPNTGQAGVSCRNTSDSCINGPPINAVCDQGDDCLDSFSGGGFAITTESVHCPPLPCFV